MICSISSLAAVSHGAALASAPFFESSQGSQIWRQVVEKLFARSWKVVPWLAIAGLLWVPFLADRLLFLSFAWIPCGYLISTAFGEVELGRYNVADIPFVFAVAGGAIQVFAQLARIVRPSRRVKVPEEES